MEPDQQDFMSKLYDLIGSENSRCYVEIVEDDVVLFFSIVLFGESYSLRKVIDLEAIFNCKFPLEAFTYELGSVLLQREGINTKLLAGEEVR